MEPNVEIKRLLDLMPASGRMLTVIVSKPEQEFVIHAELPLPWSTQRPISINFDLWQRLSRSQRDMLLLRTVSWLLNIRWFQPKIEQVLVLGGIGATIVELGQQDVIGAAVGLSLVSFAIARIWQRNYSYQVEIDADNAAIQVAQRRGYSPTEAAEALLSAMETVSKIESRTGLTFVELMRNQNLRVIAGLSAMGIPQSPSN